MKSIITSEILDVIKNNIKLTNDIHIEPYEFMSNTEDQSVVVGLVAIHIHPTGTYLYLQPEADKRYMIDWQSDIGQLVATDFKHKNFTKYFEFRTQLVDPEYKALLRIISEDEYEEFKDKGFAHLKIGDFYYTVIKLVSIDRDYNCKDNVQYVPTEQEQRAEENEEDEYDKTVEEDVQSLSLFDE